MVSVRSGPSQFSDEDDESEHQEQVVEADESLSDQAWEDELIQRGVEDFDAARSQANLAEAARKASHILHELNHHGEAKLLSEDAHTHDEQAADDAQRGIHELEEAQALHRERTTRELALQIVERPSILTSWQSAIRSITETVRTQVTDEQFAVAAGADPVEGLKLKHEIVSTGESLSRSLGHSIGTAEQAAHIIARIFDFVGAILTIYDHVPAPVKQALWHGLQQLGAFFH